MAAHQAPPSLGFSSQEHWSGLPFPSPMHQSEKSKWSRSVVSSSSDPMDCRIPGSSIHGIFQARVLEWSAIAFSAFYMLARWKDQAPKHKTERGNSLINLIFLHSHTQPQKTGRKYVQCPPTVAENMEAMEINIHWWMNKENVMFTYNGILFNF